MKRILALLIGMTAVAAADPVLTIQPGPAISGAPGQTIGWGFSLNGDATNWISIIGSLLINESNPGIGVYTDRIGLQGGPTGAVLGPGASWQQSFNPSGFEGLGSFDIDPFAVVGSNNSATVLVFYESFSADPNTCGSCLVGSGSLSAPVEVNVSAVPEPASLLMTAIASAGLVIAGRLRGKRLSQ